MYYIRADADSDAPLVKRNFSFAARRRPGPAAMLAHGHASQDASHFAQETSVSKNWKRLYFVDRNRTVPASGFAARWRQHSDLGGQFPDLLRRHVRVRYCIALDAPGLPPGDAARHDGIGMLWLGCPQELDRPNDDPNVTPIMRADELRVFEKPAFTWAMVVQEETLIDGPLQPFVFLALFTRKDADAQAPFLDACGALARELVVSVGTNAGMSRIVAGTLVRPSTTGFDATMELWFATREAALAFAWRQDFRPRLEATLGPVVQLEGSAMYFAEVCHERLSEPAVAA